MIQKLEKKLESFLQWFDVYNSSWLHFHELYKPNQNTLDIFLYFSIFVINQFEIFFMLLMSIIDIN